MRVSALSLASICGFDIYDDEVRRQLVFYFVEVSGGAVTESSGYFFVVHFGGADVRNFEKLDRLAWKAEMSNASQESNKIYNINLITV